MKVLSSLVVGLFVLTCFSFVSQLLNPPKVQAQFYGCSEGAPVSESCAQSYGCGTPNWAFCVSYLCGDYDCRCGAVKWCGGSCDPDAC